jgi:hypothetical protein
LSKSEPKAGSVGVGGELLKDDKSNEPITVFHGTSEDFDNFNEQYLGNFTGSESAGKGFFFTDSENVANTYKRAGIIKKPNIEGIKQSLEKLSLEQQESIYKKVMTYYDAFDRADPKQSVKEILDLIREDTDSHVADKTYVAEKISKALSENGVNVKPYLTEGKTYKVKLKAANPKTVDAEGMDGVEFEISKAIDAAKAEGHDALIIKSLSDEYVLNEKGGTLKPSTIYVVFDKNQIVQEQTPAKPKAEPKLKPRVETRIKFAKAIELFNDISATKGGAKKRTLSAKRKLFLEQNPSIKYIDDNWRKISKQLEDKGLLKKEGNCP